MAPRFSKQTQEVHGSCGAHASGLVAKSTETANTRREKSLLMNRMTYPLTFVLVPQFPF